MVAVTSSPNITNLNPINYLIDIYYKTKPKSHISTDIPRSTADLHLSQPENHQPLLSH